ncbi:MAG: PHP domain-containing protein [Desulfotomaculales bacterium]
MPADLHVHTTASDGTEEPASVVKKAKEIGLQAIAITDHDTVNGVPPALAAGKELNLEVVPGVELSTESERGEFHLLGYFIDFCSPELNARLEHIRNHRVERALKMVCKLREMGVAISPEQVLSEAGRAAPGRPHIARVLVREGFAGTLGEAFSRFLSRNSPAYVPRFKYSPLEAVQLIARSKGVPVLAHPGLVTGWDRLLWALIEAGLKGVEVYYPAHTPEQVEYFLELCRKYRLIPTGGSDYHGQNQKNNCFLAAATVSYSSVQLLKEASGGCL